MQLTLEEILALDGAALLAMMAEREEDAGGNKG